MKMLLLLLLVNTAYSYPIFYKCSAKGELTENFTEQEEKVLSTRLSADDVDSLTDCKSQLRQVLILTSDTMKIPSKDKIRRRDSETYNGLSKKHKALKQLRMCHQAQQVREDSDRISLYYPHETSYQYITGYRKDNNTRYDNFEKPRAVDVDQIIDESISIGVDPMAVIGMAMMERGGGGLNEYYKNMHDKRSQEVLGCTVGKFAKNGSPQIAKKSTRFNEIASKLNLGIKVESYYMCVGRVNDGKAIDDTKGFSAFRSLKSAKDEGNTCCVKTQYAMGWNEGGRRVATYLYFEENQNKSVTIPLAKNYQQSIEHRLNTFLGMSTTVGTYPSYRISPFRVGVNSYDDPNYGRQIMDYMLNSFMRSGKVMDLIHEAEKKHNKKLKSLLCFNHQAGNYIIESDFYFNKIKATTRMKPIKDLFAAGKSWDQIGIGFQSVLLQEFTYNRDQIDQESAVYVKFKKYFSPEIMAKFDAASKHLYEYRNAKIRRGNESFVPMTKAENSLFNKFYKIYFTKPEFYEYRKKLINAAKEDTSLSWSRSTDANMEEIKEETN